MHAHELLEKIGISQVFSRTAGLAHGKRLIEHLADFLFAICPHPYRGMVDVARIERLPRIGNHRAIKRVAMGKCR